MLGTAQRGAYDFNIQLRTGCEPNFCLLCLGASGMDSEEIMHSTLETSSEMSIEVSLIIFGNIAYVMMILARNLS